jgi:putative dipeptidase
MEYYFAHNGLKDPDFGFSPDAEFPIINGEKGNITAYLHFEGQNDGDFSLVSFNGGLRENMVPESASADFTGPITLKELEAKLADFVSEQEVTGQVTEEAGVFHVTIHGKSAHGMMPQNGINGATYLALFLSQFDFQGNAKTYLDIIAETLHKDFFAEKTGLAYTDPKMGELTMNAGVFNFSKESEENTIALNFRYPQGVDTDSIKADLEKLEGPKAVSLSEHGHVPHYVPVDDPMVETLLSVYEKQTGLKGHEQIIGGGTFGRLLKRGVAYGAMFPGYVNTMHQANEFTEVEDLYRAAAIYAEAIYELIK